MALGAGWAPLDSYEDGKTGWVNLFHLKTWESCGLKLGKTFSKSL